VDQSAGRFGYTDITATDTGTGTDTDNTAETKEPLVLLVEDEESFVDALLSGLPREGFGVIAARDGTEAVKLFDQVHPDIVLLDLMLPKMSGIDVCKALRERSSPPIIMVTAKTTELDTVLGLEIGADDYVTKPYRLRELVARMRAVLRRSASGGEQEKDQRANSPQESENSIIDNNKGTGDADTSMATFAADTSHQKPPPASPLSTAAQLSAGPVLVDTESHRVYVDGNEIVLPRKEFELLEIFLRNAGKVLTRDVLIDRIWGADYVGDTKTLDVHIKRLRSRLQKTPTSPAYIKTIRGIGYRFEAE